MNSVSESEDVTKAPAERKFAVLLLAHGTPETTEEIPEYLKNVVSGRALPQHVIEEIQHRYSQIGKSPLTEWTFQQAALLEKKIHLPVYVGMRNWKPYIADTVRAMRADGVTDAVAICLAPQNSRTSVGLYRRAIYAEAGIALHFHRPLRFYFIETWADHPRLVEAFADRLRPVWRQACAVVGAKVPVLFTAHSVPCRTIQGQALNASPQNGSDSAPGEAAVQSLSPFPRPAASSSGPVRPTLPERSYAVPASASADPDPYAIETKQTAALVAKRLVVDGLTDGDWYFAFQSQGMSGGPWIGPTVEATLQAIRHEGHRAVVLQPIGFLCDHVEILYDIDIGFQELANKLNLKLFRSESLNACPVLIDALANLVLLGLAELETAVPIPLTNPA